ncbi:MAG: penicillin acylase family protein [Gammaproteobacteria bacterium]|nr:penicillin acylase family protein [Gammaproteobacteria bacterium]MDE0440774.1 penicillin acylase family protein [Gammaproteobacteria bacterium]
MPITRTDLEAALPDMASTMRVIGLEHPVEVVRDGWGIPHIRAASVHDAFFAQGFVTAQDRLWHMDYDRHRALGRWSEFAGRLGLGEDRLMRAFGVERAAKADLAVSSDDAQAMLEAYSDGVNAFIGTTRSLPVEYKLLDVSPEPWQPWHCLAVYKVRNMLMGTYQVKLWRARLAAKLGAERAKLLFRRYPHGGLVSVPPGETYGAAGQQGLASLSAAVAELPAEDGGSNAWVVAGPRTASGLPLVAGDSHRALDTPNVYYQVHINCPAFRCSGYALPGVPGMPHFSHTEYVAWGMTHGVADYQDLYIERFRTEDGRLEYAHRDDWLPAEVTREVLSVRDGEPETLPVVRTRHGPIIAGDPERGQGIAFSHTGTQSGTAWPNTLYELLLAKSADEAEEALREWTEPVNNFVYADVHGDFGYRYRGRIPVRSMANAWTPVPGWTGAHEWRGRIPFDEMPSARNPQPGYVVTCNNAPANAAYPHYINTNFAPDWRARRVTARIEEIPFGTATPDHMASIHADRESIPARILVERLSTLDPKDPDARAGRDILRDWDCRIDRASVAATVYGAARAYLFGEVVEAVFGEMATEGAAYAAPIYADAVRSAARGEEGGLADGRSWDTAIESALANGVRELRSRLGTDSREWTWGTIHRTRPRHPLSRVFPECAELLDPPGLATHGDADTPLAGAYALTDGFTATAMSVNRYIHDPADWRNSRWIVPLGASGHPGSPHYADQAERWADVETIPQLWDWNDILAAAEMRQTLMP